MSFSNRALNENLNSVVEKIREQFDENSLDSKENLIELSEILNRFSLKMSDFEGRVLKKITENHPDDAEAYYLYSSYIYRSKGSLETALKYAKKSIDVLKNNGTTVSSFSKHFIMIASRLNEGFLIRAELERISQLVNLNSEQKKYLVSDLVNTNLSTYIPFEI